MVAENGSLAITVPASYPWPVMPPRFPRIAHSSRTPRATTLAAALLLAVVVLTGCADEGASTDCGLDECIVTFERGVEAEANVLGVQARLVGADDRTVTLEVAGEQVSLTTGQRGTEVGGVWVSIDRVDDEQVSIRLGLGPG